MKASNDSTPIRIGEFIQIRQRGKKGIFIAEFRHNGEHKKVSLKTARRPVAERKARELEVSLANESYSPAMKPVAIDDAIQQFIESKVVDQRRKNTLTKYETELKNFATYAKNHGVTTLTQLTPTLHDRYRGHRLQSLEAYTVYTHAVMLKGFTKWCESRDLIAVDPLRKVRLSEPVRGNKWSPPLAVVNQLLTAAAADPKLQNMLAVLAFTGIRSGELVFLRPQDVDLDQNWIHITSREDWQSKTGPSRKVPIHRRLRPHIIAALKASFGKPQVFCAETSAAYPKGNHRYSQDKLLLRSKKLAATLGIPVGHEKTGFVIHSLRHFFESFCINSRIPQRAVDVWMGHVGDRSTGRLYYGLSDEESQEFMNQVPFDRTAANDQRGVSNVA